MVPGGITASSAIPDPGRFRVTVGAGGSTPIVTGQSAARATAPQSFFREVSVVLHAKIIVQYEFVVLEFRRTTGEANFALVHNMMAIGNGKCRL